MKLQIPTVPMLCAMALPAQLSFELTAVDFVGNIHAVTLADGAKRFIRHCGITEVNAMAELGGKLFVTGRAGNQRRLAQLDPVTNVATPLPIPFNLDIRGMAGDSQGNHLLAIVDGGTGNDNLVRVEVTTGAVTPIGSTGRKRIQALVRLNARLYVWDLDAGLMLVDRRTAQTTDVSPFGTGGVAIQYLALDHLDRVVGGEKSLYRLDLATGIPQLLGGGGDAVSLRGAELRVGRITEIGVGCPDGVDGRRLSAGSLVIPGAGATLFSTRHTPTSVGTIVLGAEGAALPIAGSTCLRFVTEQQVLPVVTDAGGGLKFNIQLPSANGAVLSAQMITLEPVPGGVVTTNVVRFELPL